MSHLDRRSFLAATAASLPVLGAWRAAAANADPAPARDARLARNETRPVAIASGNGRAAVERAVQLMREGSDPLDAAVMGIEIVENDPDDMTVGLGGLPNEEGVVELDASCMHGPSHKAGAVASLRNIRNPAQVALRVLRRTNHTLLVGEGALRFARAHGFQEENLLTDRAREAWLKWKENLNPRDDWLDEDQHVGRPGAVVRAEDIPWTTGTIHCACVNQPGDLGSCTSTSGLSYKIPGRVGDSPIIGAGNFCDNAVGAAGATGRGESVIKSCGAFQVVRHMEDGLDPTEACLKVLKWIADHTKRARLLNARSEPNFNVVMYALRKDGAYGSAAMRRGGSFAVCDARGPRTERCAFLFE